MFSNFIYFIIVVLIYSTYHHAGETNFTLSDTLFIFFLLIILFTFLTWIQFHRIKKQTPRESSSQLDHKFNAALTRQSVMAIALFAINIYGLNLTAFVSPVPIFSFIPILQAVLFLGLFVFYLSIVWGCAHDAHQQIYRTEFTRSAYILSNISFSIPVLLPWILVSGIVDIINVLPFELPKRLLATTAGEVTYFLLFLIVIAITSPAIIQRFWRCEPLEPGVMRSRIENLCRKSGLEYNNILYWPIFGGKMITAGVMGLVKKFRFILVTRALLRVLEPEEVDAVIAHEIAHIKKKHLVFYLVFFGGYMLLSYASFNLIIYSIIYIEPLYRFIIDAGLNQTTLVSTLNALIFIISLIIYFRFIFGYFMRNFERQADTYVYSISDTAKPLISTLEKIALTSGCPPEKPNWHHFSITERINYLEKCDTDKVWIVRQENKIKKSIAVYLAGIVLVGGLGYHLNFGEAGKRLNKHFFEKIIHRELSRDPDNPSLYSMLGEIYYSKNNYSEAIQSYKKSLRRGPNNSRVLNNLAWLYATCQDHNFRNPKEAVRLAEKAAKLDNAPHIWDTLAESYYVNGNYEKAVAAAKHALKLARKNRSYYEKQLRKFMNATEKVRL